jgi:dihydrofolate reductase
MKTQFYGAASLDGFLATNDDSLDWLLQLGDLEETSYPYFIKEVGALAMGAATYEWLLRNLVKQGTAQAQPWPYEQPAWVFTHRSFEIPAGADVRFVSGDVRPVHAAMAKAAAGKNIWIMGGGELVGQFYDAGLLDEMIVQIASVTLGQGKPMFPREVIKPPLRLKSVQSFGTAFAELSYDVPQRR